MTLLTLLAVLGSNGAVDEAFDGPPEAPVREHRAAQFAGALLGGAIGLAAPLAFLPLADAACPPPTPGFAFPCMTGGHFAIGLSSLTLVGVGAWAGHALLGGEGGALVPFGGVVAGMASASLLFFLARALSLDASPATAVPFLAFGGALVVSGAAWALDLRDGAVRRHRVTSNPARVAVTAAVTLLGYGAVTGLVFGMAQACLSCGGAAAIVALAGYALTPLLAWGVHSAAFGGRGSALAAYAPLLFAVVFGLVTGGAAGIVSGGGGSLLAVPAISAAVAGGTMLLGLGPAALLEWSHGSYTLEEVASRVRFGVAPLPGGGVVTASVALQ